MAGRPIRLAKRSPPKRDAGTIYSRVAIGCASQSRLFSPNGSASNQRPSSWTAKLAFQFSEMTHDAEGMRKSASDERRGSRSRLCAKAVRPKDQTVSADAAAAIGTGRKAPSKLKRLLNPRLKSCRASV